MSLSILICISIGKHFLPIKPPWVKWKVWVAWTSGLGERLCNTMTAWEEREYAEPLERANFRLQKRRWIRFSLLYTVERIIPLILVVVLRSSLPGIARYRRPGDFMKLFRSLFFIFCQNLSSLDKALIEKPMLVQVGSFLCGTSNLSSGTALQQDFVICKVGWKHSIMDILAAVHFAWYFSFAVIVSEIHPTDHQIPQLDESGDRNWIKGPTLCWGSKINVKLQNQ